MLEIFNLALGSGAEASLFWRSVLADLAFQKFSLELPDTDKVDKRTLVHLPQLSAALQYHTGCLLRDRPDYDFSPFEATPVRDEDLVECLVPAVKLPSSVPGEVGIRLAHAEALLGAGLYAEAATALQLRLQLQQLQSNDSTQPRHAAEVCDTVYKIALAQYQQGDHKGCCDAISKCLQSRHRYSALSARLMTLLMCAQFLDGDTAAALQSFEVGQEMYLYSLGDKHPACAMHLCALGDCYHAAGHPRQALAMLTLAQHVSKALLGEGHLLTASYSVKCAVLSVAFEAPRHVPNPITDNAHESALHSAAAAAAAVAEQEYIRATLQDSLKVLDTAAHRGASVGRELATCLFACMASERGPGCLDAAARHATRCLDLLRSLAASSSNGKLKLASTYQSPEALSCVLTLAEARSKAGDISEAVWLYESAWEAVRLRPTDYAHVGATFALLSCRLVGTLFHSLALQTRSLLVAVAAEVANGLHGGAREWAEACEVVIKVVWEGGTKLFFQTTVDGLIQAEIQGGGGTVEHKEGPNGVSKPQRRASNFAAATQASFQARAVEVAVLLRLVELQPVAMG